MPKQCYEPLGLPDEISPLTGIDGVFVEQVVGINAAASIPAGVASDTRTCGP